MTFEVLLSTMNLKKKDLKKRNIKSQCVVINQCNKNNYEEYKNFKIYSYDELGVANSRNRALEHATSDIVIFCDDDVIYNDNYEETILSEFGNNTKADVIFFNLDSPNRETKLNKRDKRLHFYNILRYGTYCMAIKRNKINFKFNNQFGGNAKYSGGSGEDTLFIVSCLKHKLKLYSSTKNIGMVEQKKSVWFKGHNEKYFFDKGALFYEINQRFNKFLCLQHLLRHKEVLDSIKFKRAFKLMMDGIKAYKKGLNFDEYYKN